MNLNQTLKELFRQQIQSWELAQTNYQALLSVRTKVFGFSGYDVKVQFNPARIKSSSAVVNSEAIAQRACFLCKENRPEEQVGTGFGNFELLLNPYPIFPEHFTIVHKQHLPQEIRPYFKDMLMLAKELSDYVVFYNGPKCGASAPDHVHFQAGTKTFLPLIDDYKNLKPSWGELLKEGENFQAFTLNNYHRTLVCIESADEHTIEKVFGEFYAGWQEHPDEEPMMNIVCSYENGRWYVYIFPRAHFRPRQYYTADTEKQLLVSPAAVEMGGIIITPVEAHFNKIGRDDIIDLFGQSAKRIGLPEDTEPVITVGIMSQSAIDFQLHGDFIASNGKIYTGNRRAVYQREKISFDGQESGVLTFRPLSDDAFFELQDVVIGINFHWERKENQRFKGELKLIVENEKLTAINCVGLEDYLTSVISSEMSATASEELLKAHAVISRSWLLHPMQRFAPEQDDEKILRNEARTQSGEVVKWYERDAHTHFDVCADDHCQRYQGITRASTGTVKKAIATTRGEVLIYGGRICDARFSKSCGGISEAFENVWAPVHYPYLSKIIDHPAAPDGFDTDLTIEANAEKWIRGFPLAYCNTDDKKTLSQALNNYDRETTHFYRWQIAYSQKELSALIKQRSGIDFGAIIDLIPVERGESGRLIKLRIAGSKQTQTVGKELEIRKWLSDSHLYSAAFVIDRVDIQDNIPQKFILTGAGWGHGVGLCQIGAAVMGEKGYKYDEILSHYYNKSEIRKIYR
ncbi:MAG: DUF4922 domain-containing protein [Prevotellaceae bacterium]|jgi:SpoIID/LytB domain protein|nr:DUF4922 domain-containing protein [Prevotellaceae bacterium]